MPGTSGNPSGRPEGAKSVLSEKFVTALAGDFETNGTEAIVACREQSPFQYLSIIAKVIPKDFQLDHNPYADLSDEELEERVLELSAELGFVPKEEKK